MEILRFYSRKPRAKYAGLVELLCDKLANVLVIARPTMSPAVESIATDPWNGVEVDWNRGSLSALAS